MRTRQAFEGLGLIIDGSGDPKLLDLDKATVVELFKAHGLLLFQSFDVDTATFEEFTNWFSNDYMDHKGGGSLREVINKEGDGTILSVSYAHKTSTQRTFALALHSDRSYTKTKPPVMWFYCVVPASAEGETIVCDGAQIYEKLSSSTKNLLKQKRIKYIRHYKEEEWQLLWQTKNTQALRAYCEGNGLTLTIGSDNSITTEYVTPAYVKTRWGKHDAFVNSILLVLWQEEDLRRNTSLVRMEDGSKIPQDVIAEIRNVSENLTHDIAWNAGEIAMIDNTRILHGRRAFSDPKREIYVRMCRSVDW